MKKLLISSMLVCCGVSAGSNYAASVPRGVAADHRVQIVQYDPNNIVILKGRYGYQTQITFAPNETVQSVSLGDSMAWQAVPVNNYLFIKPVATSKTNMTVLTNMNSYNFQLDSQDQNVSSIYKVQFVYSQGGYDASGNANAVATFDPEKINWKYSFTGDKSLAPLETFDNGQFTYFKFNQGGMSRLPSVFVVDKERNETLVNYHMQGSYVVVHSVAKQFTLRDGAYVTSVYNDLAIGDWKAV